MNLYLIATIAGDALALAVPTPAAALYVLPMAAYKGADGSSVINVRQLQASTEIAINDSVYVSGVGVVLSLQTASTPGRMSIKNVNGIGGADIALTVPDGCTFEFVLNGTGTVSPHSALTIEYDGAGGFWII